MRKGFTRKPKADEPATPGKNYITPSGLQRLQDEHRFLLTRERRAVTEVVAWAASNGDRSENADYQYGKRRLRQIDGRIRFLRKRIEAAEVVDPETPRTGQAATRAFFGATVRYANAAGVERVVSIVGTDEVDLERNHISWVSPLGRALLKSAAGDTVVLQAPGGTEHLDVLEVCYWRISVDRSVSRLDPSPRQRDPLADPFRLTKVRATKNFGNCYSSGWPNAAQINKRLCMAVQTNPSANGSSNTPCTSAAPTAFTPSRSRSA